VRSVLLATFVPLVPLVPLFLDAVAVVIAGVFAAVRFPCWVQTHFFSVVSCWRTATAHSSDWICSPRPVIEILPRL